MEGLIEFSQIARQSRHDFVKKYGENCVKAEINENDNKKSNIKIMESDNPIDYTVLEEFGKDIDKDYIVFEDEKAILEKKKDYNEKLRKCHIEKNNMMTLIFEKSFNRSFMEPQYYDNYYENSVYNTQNNAHFNFKKQYYDCIDKLKEYGFVIYGVMIDSSKYENGTTIMQSNVCFMFKCEKGVYRFDMDFSDDGECYPGIFNVKNLINKNTNEMIEIKCDLYCQTTSEGQLREFLKLLEYNDYQSYITAVTSHLIELCSLLEKNGYIIEQKKWINTNDFHKINYGEKIYIVVNKNSAKYILSLNRFNKDEKIYIFKNEKSNSQNGFCVKYDSSDKFDLLCKNINSYEKFLMGEYGYYDEISNSWKNEKNVIELFGLKSFVEEKINCDKEFCVTMKYVGGEENEICPYNFKDSSLDMKYLCDFYCVEFWCDDNNLCHVTIGAKYVDLTELVKNSFNDNMVINNGSIAYDGTFDDCVFFVHNFFEKIGVDSHKNDNWDTKDIWIADGWNW